MTKEEIHMRGIVLRWLTLTLAILMASYLLSGIHISGFWAAVAAAAAGFAAAHAR